MLSARVLLPPMSPVRPTARRVWRTAAVATVALLVLAGCSDDVAGGGSESGAPGEDSADLDAIEVVGDFGEEPTITFDTPLALEESASRTLSEGDGDEIEDGDTVKIDYSIVSGLDGSALDTSFGGSPISLPLVQGQTPPAIVDALIGETIGSRVLIAVAPEPAPGASAAPEAAPSPSPGNPAGDTIIFVIDTLDLVPERAEGTAYDPPAGTPVVSTDDAGDVTGLDVDGVTAPGELVVTPLVEGDGDVVAAGDTVTIHYTGVLASDGTEFDSSWSRGAAATFPLGTLIQGWQQGLEGVAVGSRVVLQVPSDLGYGTEGSPPTIPADADLVFVIDVLDTEAAPEAPSAPAPAPSQ